MHDWYSEIVKLLFAIVVPFGPALYLWWRSFRKQPVSTDALVGVLIWTAIMLAIASHREMRTEQRREEACQAFKRDLAVRIKGDEDPWDRLPDACKLDDYDPGSE